MKLQVGKEYTFVLREGDTFFLSRGKVIKVGRKYVHYQFNDLPPSKLELSKIVEVVEAGSPKEKEWKNYISAIQKWQNEYWKTKRVIEREEMNAMWDRVEKRIKQWEKENPKPIPPLKSLKQSLQQNEEIYLLRRF